MFLKHLKPGFVGLDKNANLESLIKLNYYITFLSDVNHIDTCSMWKISARRVGQVKNMQNHWDQQSQIFFFTDVV